MDDALEVDGGDAAESTNDISADTKIQQGASKSAEQIGKSEDPSSNTTTTSAVQPPASPETLAKKTGKLICVNSQRLQYGVFVLGIFSLQFRSESV